MAQEAERKKREKRRIKELNGANGTETPEGDEEGEGLADKALPLRKHQSQASRSMSPAVGRLMNGSHNLSGAFGANRTRSPPPVGANGTRDSFLNYFFGKEGPPAGPQSLDNRPGSRHVSQNSEPSFAQSIRRGDTRQPAHVLEVVQDEYDPASPTRDYEGGFVREAHLDLRDVVLTMYSHLTRKPRRRSLSARPWKRSLSAASSRHTLTLCVRRLRTRCPRQ